MNQEQINRVRAAMKNQQAKGVKVIDGDWGVELDTAFVNWTPNACSNPHACALGCLLLEAQPGLAADQEFAAAAVLGTDTEAIGAFTTGFDGDDFLTYTPEHRDWFEAGRALRKEFGLATDDEAVA